MGCGASIPEGGAPQPAAIAGAAVTKAAEAAKVDPQLAAKAGQAVTKAVTAVAGVDEDKQVVQPKQPLKVAVWQGDSAEGTLIFPELSDGPHGIPSLASKKDIAICMSGGGLRAASCGIGWVRALHMMGVLSQAKYLMTNSGNSWLNGALSFQSKVPLSTFLGNYIPPEDLDGDALESIVEGSFEQALADCESWKDYAAILLKSLGTAQHQQVRAWSASVSNAFLKPFGVDESRSTVTAMGTRGKVHERVIAAAKELGCEDVLCALKDTSLPYPILVQSVIIKDEDVVHFPYEWTPLYAGVPTAFTNSKSGLPIGAGWVEPLGINSMPPKSLPAEQGGQAELPVKSIVPLADAVGISSGFIAQKMVPDTGDKAHAKSRIAGNAVFDVFDMQGQQPRASRVPFGDGGGSDNLAVYPALRRRVPRLVVCSANKCTPDDPKFAGNMWDLSQLFGVYPLDGEMVNGVKPAVWNTSHQVFPSEAWPELVEAMKAKYQAGKPLTHRAKYTVLPCKAMGVQGGYEVEVLWVWNGPVKEWEAKLPEGTRETIEEDRKSKLGKMMQKVSVFEAIGLGEFPLVNTFRLNYPPELVVAMSNLACYCMLQAKDEIQAMLA